MTSKQNDTMASCPRYQKWISAYQDDELPARLRRKLERHLASCSACRAEAQALESLSTLLQRSLQHEADHAWQQSFGAQGHDDLAVAQRVASLAGRGQERHGSRWSRWRPVRRRATLVPATIAVAAALVLALTIGLTSLVSDPTRDDPAPTIAAVTDPTDNHCRIESLQFEGDTAVVFETPHSHITVIWLSDAGNTPPPNSRG